MLERIFSLTDVSWLITLVIGFVSFLLAKHYYRFYTLDFPGPTPLPFIGNYLTLRKNSKRNPFFVHLELKKKYGGVYQFWMGSVPTLIITDLDLAKEAFQTKGKTFSGRPSSAFTICFPEGSTDIAHADYGPTWVSLRRLFHAAALQYARSEKLAYLTSEIVDDTFKIVFKKEEVGNPFDLFSYITLAVLNIFASSAFAVKYTIEDPEFLTFKRAFENRQEVNFILFINQYFPFLKPMFQSKYKSAKDKFQGFLGIFLDQYKRHQNDFDANNVRDFTDALIMAKEEALRERKESAPHLTDDNLALAILNFFGGGTDNIQTTLRWMVLLMCRYPELQMRMRNEVDSVLGDRMPVQQDKNSLPFVNAFILESLRYRGLGPMGMQHTTTTDTDIDGHKVPKGVNVMVHSWAILNDPRYWKNPDTFDPTRFLDPQTGKLLPEKSAAFVPFSLGRRICPGEKLALADLFLATARIFQATTGHKFAVLGGPEAVNLEPIPQILNFCIPHNQKILLQKL